MMTAPAIWVENFKVHSYEVDFKGTATLEMICRYFQEAAWNHAEALGVGFERLVAKQKLWVLSRLLMEIERFPRWGETFEVQTWPRAIEGPFAMRDFEFSDGNRHRIAGGTSAWLVLSAANRRPQRVDKMLANIPDTSGRRATDRSPEKLTDTGAGSYEIRRFETQVRHSDLDVNNHVNNSRYLGWVLDSYPAEFHRKNRVHSCEVNYLGETAAGEKLLIESRVAEGTMHLHCISNAAGEPVCRARLGWRAINGA